MSQGWADLVDVGAWVEEALESIMNWKEDAGNVVIVHDEPALCWWLPHNDEGEYEDGTVIIAHFDLSEGQ